MIGTLVSTRSLDVEVTTIFLGIVKVQLFFDDYMVANPVI